MCIYVIAAALLACVLPPSYGNPPTTMAQNKVLVSSKDFPESGLKVLQDNNFTVVQTQFLNFGEEGKTKNNEELLKLIPGSSALIWVSNLPLSTELLDKAGPQLKIVATASAGYNHCNVNELKSRGIKLSNTPNVLSPAVAEIAVSLVLAAARRFTENLDQVRRGEWEIGFDKVLGQDVRGSTFGIVGLGGIGQAVVRRLAGFEVGRFLYTGHREKPEGKELKAEFVALDELLAQSDFVVLAVPLTEETRHMINSTTLGKMKKNAILVNVGRGDLVDQDALYDALKNKQIYAAGLDVTTPEPLPKDHKLLSLSNLFVLPHVGSATVRTRSDMAVLAANNVVKVLNGEKLLTPVLD
ncbi:glyoxylate reductase/hydroxypyruvate reductase-like [Pectinophora gossypiella]|uniref:glyoxylate reductase/hydroxypyruvate reductase-like n=1 Tax=Pectinophora gossypiella TaxID=13191 RepID=UPI00214E2E4D|nr:glyoxylate reductase/hydroxypyruvate reductase-like [Pectinophora gossypiella]